MAAHASLLVTLFAFDLPPAAAEPVVTGDGTPELRAGRVPDELALDGRLDEAAWRQAYAITGLTLIEPVEGGTPTQPTTVRVLAGARAVVIGVESLDARPAEIVSYSKARVPLDVGAKLVELKVRYAWRW